jgi:phospholipid/cholesterol/gamma-HCH transport system ATP-binding protein
MAEKEVHLAARDLTIGYDGVEIIRDINFEVARGTVFIIMGGSGSGKSTLLRSMIGLLEPLRGDVVFAGTSFTAQSIEERRRTARRFGVLFQTGALWSSMSVIENVSLPLEEYTELSAKDIAEIARLKLALVGLAGSEELYPGQLSGGMQKRTGLARALALDPEILFLDEPSSGLDPISAKRFDDLVVEVQSSLGMTVVAVTHELASIFAIGTDSILLDGKSRSVIAEGDPRQLRDHSPDHRVREFLTRGEAK